MYGWVCVIDPPFPDGPFLARQQWFFSIDVGILGARWPNMCMGASIGVIDVVIIDLRYAIWAVAN